MQKELLARYVKLEAKFKEIELEKQLLREEIVVDFKKNKLEKVESEWGNFTIAHKMSWTYTDAVKKISDKLKIAKSKEEQKGLATSTQTDYLLFKPQTNE